ncbi:hypothetical protein SAMN05444287_2470 [Octadecabacter temperatus]|jgi:hypothetical protein|uniref:Uncharacterized protein n=1 Tax=Octadecabacter temperatus TaxID=1458307 RepID=A0A0K0Y0Z3_9RHOB|nr:hypothetical protein [Octadecabacter temperatus]AKS44618.1 hypothetical protein OSB_00490 [Octadecabacter temperatus]SIO37375.1 hypothetical protein SAMN05444287_2470 [Octadecabacter temperatus]
MLRLVLSIILVFVFTGASTASVMHGLNHGSDHADHHAQTSESDPLADAEKALADCCDASSGMGSMPCFGDLAAASAILQVIPASRSVVSVLHANFDFANLTLAVPTGPPKV